MTPYLRNRYLERPKVCCRNVEAYAFSPNIKNKQQVNPNCKYDYLFMITNEIFLFDILIEN